VTGAPVAEEEFMARTQAADYEDRRLAIIETAARLYADRGFLGASIADLAAACGASKALIYHYFPSKEDILFEVMDSHIRALSAIEGEIAQLDGEPEDRLRALTHKFLQAYVGAEARHKVLLNDLDRLPEERRTAIIGRQRAIVDYVAKLLEEVQPSLADRGLGRSAAMLYFGMINWTHTWFRANGPVTPDVLANLAADIVTRGLAPPQA
jgi:AcrR family transcriptional regulator